MRIISGSWRSQSLKVPPGVRPTTDRVREAIFSILGDADNLEVLDLYAGSGALGIEALSRGARSVHFVDLSRHALTTIQDNLRGKEVSNVHLLRQDAQVFLKHADHPFGWIFCDPPYDRVDYYKLLHFLVKSVALGDDSLLILETDCYHTLALPEELELTDKRRFGDTVIHLIRRRRVNEASSGEDLQRA